MIADLNFKSKSTLDPFIISKLDVNTIKYFMYPKLPATLNKNVLKSKGIIGLEYLKQTEKFAIAGVAK